MNLEQVNTELQKYAQGRVSVQFSEACQVYYTYDSFTGPGKAIVGTFAEAVERVSRLMPSMAKYAMWVEAALSNDLEESNYV